MPAVITKPKVFIASSSSALNYTTAVKDHIQDKCEIHVWADVPDYPAKTITDWLVMITERYDFGVFIFSNDDKAKIDKKHYAVVRDNVLFELGLFVGQLGWERCSILRPKINNFHLPYDLEGILQQRFEVPKADEEIKSALRVPCGNIRNDISRHWETILEQRKKEVTPERVAAICYRKNSLGLYEFLLVNSSDKKQIRRGFPKKPFNKNDTRQPIDVAIEVAAEEGGVKVRKAAKVPDLQPFQYKKESELKNTVIKYTPFLLEVVDDVKLPDANKHRIPKFFTLGEVFTELRSNRNDNESIKSLERVICQCYDFLLRS
ncbi:MAG: TIR domain-containing protein [Ferruginibacter sp.]